MTVGYVPSLTTPAVCTWDDIKALCAEAGVCTSIYLGAYHYVGASGLGTRPDRVRLRTMLGEIDRHLVAGQMGSADRTALLDPLWHVLTHLEDERDFGHSDGIAWLRSTHSFLQFRLPWEVEDSWSVESRFNVRPLLRFLSPRRRFHVLALSRNHVRLLEGNDTGCATVMPPPGLPASLDEFGMFDRPEYEMAASAREKEYRHEYDMYCAADRALQPLLRAKPWPLVVTGTEEAVATYRTVNTYEDLVSDAVVVSPDGGLTDRDLGRMAREVVSRWRSKEERRALAQLSEAEGSIKASTVTEEIVQAAATGRVLHLFLEDGRRQMGDVYKLTGRIPEVDVLAAPEDLVNAAVVETVRHGGNVWQMGGAETPATLAAVFRY